MRRAGRPSFRCLGLVGLVGLEILLAPTGCFTPKSEGDETRDQVKTITQRFDAREAQWNQAIQSYQDEVAKLHETLKEAAELMARNSANVGQEVQDLQMTLAQTKGDVDESKQAIAKLTKDLADFETRTDSAVTALTRIVMAPPASAPIVTADGLFAKAYKEYSQKKYDTARTDFRDFLLKFPFDPRAANAQFWIGDAFLQENNYASAIPEYQKVLDNYPSSDVADQAMFKEGQAFFAVKWCSPALAYLGDLPKKYPTSSSVVEAKKLVLQIKKAQRTKGACTR